MLGNRTINSDTDQCAFVASAGSNTTCQTGNASVGMFFNLYCVDGERKLKLTAQYMQAKPGGGVHVTEAIVEVTIKSCKLEDLTFSNLEPDTCTYSDPFFACMCNGIRISVVPLPDTGNPACHTRSCGLSLVDELTLLYTGVSTGQVPGETAGQRYPIWTVALRRENNWFSDAVPNPHDPLDTHTVYLVDNYVDEYGEEHVVLNTTSWWGGRFLMQLPNTTGDDINQWSSL